MQRSLNRHPTHTRFLTGVLSVLLLLAITTVTGCAQNPKTGADGDVPTLVVMNPNGTEASLTDHVEGEAQMPAAIPACPSSTTLLSWAEIPGGWVLVCGITEDQPTLWISSIDGQESRSESVIYSFSADSSTQAGGPAYTAALPEGNARLSFAPATLRVMDGTGSIASQSSVLAIFFVNLGYSAPAEGAGAFDLDAPNDTAEDQVRYLAELLETSYEGRAQLQGAVAAVEDCTSPAEVERGVEEIANVRDNRAYLLSALTSAPVDKVPDGVLLLNTLVSALQNSYNADVGYLQWGEQVRDQGCGSGSSAEGDRYSSLGRPHKKAFSELWNQVIYPYFDVQSIDPGKL